jgi:capsular exopolysaccharide synthesis family protein
VLSLRWYNKKLDSKLDANNNSRPGRPAQVEPELVHLPVRTTRLATLADAISYNPEVEDAYVALFGAVRLSQPFASGNSVLVTSTAPGEGKTTVASCLAITASQAGQTALLIDGDLRRSSLASAAGISDGVGLTEILLGQAEAAEAIHPIAVFADSPRPGLVNVMAGGRRSAIVLPVVDWSKARAAFKSICQRFGIVLVDSPPILAANDALLLASIVDAVLMVVGVGTANLDELRRAKQQLEQTGTPVIGAVLNRFEPGIHGKSNQPYRGYYRGA